MLRPLLLDSLFDVTEILKIINAVCGHYLLSIIIEKKNTCSFALLKINYCDAGTIYLSLDTNKMYLLSMYLSLNFVNRHTLHFKVTFENTFCTLLKKLMETNTVTYDFDKTFLGYGVQ